MKGRMGFGIVLAVSVALVSFGCEGDTGPQGPEGPEGPEGPAWKDEQVADAVDMTVQAIEKIRKRFVNEGLEAAVNRKKQAHPSRARLLDGSKEAKLVALCCASPPEGRSRWTLQLLADQLVTLEVVDSISRETVRQTLKKTN